MKPKAVMNSKPELAGNPTCIQKPCPMTAGFPIGGGKWVCWLHSLMPPFNVIEFDTDKMRGMEASQ